MGIRKCNACGNEKVEVEYEEQTLQLPFGSEQTYTSVVVKCDVCGCGLDETDDNHIEEALKQSRKDALLYITEELEKINYSNPALERIIGLPFGSINEGIEKGDHTLYALFNCIARNPEIINEDNQIFFLL